MSTIDMRSWPEKELQHTRKSLEAARARITKLEQLIDKLLPYTRHIIPSETALCFGLMSRKSVCSCGLDDLKQSIKWAKEDKR